MIQEARHACWIRTPEITKICFLEIFQSGLRKADRGHVHLVVGTGKNGFGKGQFGVTVDKNYKSDSANFQATQKAANDRTAVGKISVVSAGDTVWLRNSSGSVKRPELVMDSFKFQGEFDGFTFFQFRGKFNEGPYSRGPYTEAVVDGDRDEIEIATTMHHELRAHMVLGDFGRQASKAHHSDPFARGQGPAVSEADKVGEAAENEARDNAKKKP
jgi:hypothetical protein